MDKWVYTDAQGRVLGSNPGDMSGNTGWYSITGTVPEELTNVDGVPLYERSGNKVVPRSAAEIAADAPQAAPTEPTADERIEALEAAVLEMILGGAVDG